MTLADIEDGAGVFVDSEDGQGAPGAVSTAHSEERTVNEQSRAYDRPSRLEFLFNRTVGGLVRLGIGLPHMRLLEVRGRTSGKLYSLPVDLLSEQGKLYLVAPRGHTQ